VAAVLGIVGLILFIACVIAMAAAITWVVIKVTPDKKRKKPSEPAPSEPAPSEPAPSDES
jgi:hypothetical protein